MTGLTTLSEDSPKKNFVKLDEIVVITVMQCRVRHATCNRACNPDERNYKSTLQSRTETHLFQMLNSELKRQQDK